MFILKGFCLAIFCMVCLPLVAEEKEAEETSTDLRVWTDSKTSRTLKGVITDKHSSGKKIEIRKDGGGYVWLTIEQLIEKDQDYAKMWVKAQDSISLVNKRVKKGGERVIKVYALAGTKAMKVEIITKTIKGTVFKTMKAGEKLDFEITVRKGYSVSGYHGTQLVDQETALKKTGLQKKTSLLE